MSWTLGRSPIGPCWPVGLLDAVDGYRQAKQAAARTVLEAKTRVWEEFGEAMEEDYRSASKRFWQTVRRLRRGKQYSANTVYSAGGELLTSTEDIVGLWRKYFEDLLNPTDLPSNEEVEAGDSEVDSSITQAEVTEVVRKLRSGKAPGVDEIRPEYLKSLDVVGLSWLTRLCNIAWRLGTVPLEWQTWGGGPSFKKVKRGPESVFQLQGDHTSQPPREGLRQGTGEENSADSRTSDSGGTMRFSSLVVEHWTSSIPSTGCLRVYGSLPTSPHVLCGSGEGIRPRVPRVVVVFCGVLHEYGVRGPFAKGCSVSVRPEAGAWFALPAVRFLGVARGLEGVRFGNHRISSLLFADDVVLMASSGQDLQHVLERFAAECECEAAGMRISTSKSEAMVLDRKRVACPLRVGGEVLPQVEEFKYLGEGKMEREIDRRIGAASMQLCSRCTGRRRGEEGAESKGEALDLPVPVNLRSHLTYGHELWVMTERTRAAEMRKFPSFLQGWLGAPLEIR
ncbi:hypothetical protein L3Q82_022339 [Scortum barcoo]|uniref:Uncharacterized protein n=1 Tax=Scortum barcoo TaxID=214431 RepID=A0ACB8X120_9TELE|nr:hypothetical protein L3Q82_022339 [Scortum barcoo]